MKANQIIESLTAPGSKMSIAEAANSILSEGDLKKGQQVAVIEDPTWPQSGQKGRVRSVESLRGSGFVDVEFADGVVVPMQASLLIPLAS